MTQKRSGGIAGALAVVALAALYPIPATAQEKYPVRSIRLVVPFPPGGGTDIMGRNLESRMGRLLGQQVVVDNRTGAGGAIGAAEVARARADGYTLLLGTSSTHVINQLAMDNRQYDAIASFAPVNMLGIGTYVIVSHPSVAQALPELIRRIKASPGKYSYGAVSGMAQMSGELFKQRAGVDILHVPYRLTGQNLTDLMGGQIPLTSTVLSVATPPHRSGKVRIIAVFAGKRSAAVPDVPTALEVGVPGMIAYTFNILFVPAATPQSIVEQLHQVTAKVVRDEGFQNSADSLGIEPVIDSSPEHAARVVKDEIAKWAPIVRATGMMVN